MSRSTVFLMMLCASVVTACGPHGAASSPPAQSSILEDCKTGLKAGADCERAQAAEAHRVHREAESAFRNMSAGR